MPDRGLTPTTATLLGAVEALPRDATGAFVVSASDGRQLGALLADGNRVCWAVIAGHGRRLRNLMQLPPEAAPLDGQDLAHAVAPAALRAALKQHTVESLIRLDGCVGVASWVDHRGGGYRPRCTFTPAELFAAVGAELYAAEAIGAATLDDILPAGAIGASFAVGDDGEAVAVHEIGVEHLGLAGLGELGTWAVAALDVTRGFSRAAMERALASAHGRVAVAWRTGRRLVHALVIDDPTALVRTIADLDRRGLPTVLSTRAPGAPAAVTGMVPARPDATP